MFMDSRPPVAAASLTVLLYLGFIGIDNSAVRERLLAAILIIIALTAVYFIWELGDELTSGGYSG